MLYILLYMCVRVCACVREYVCVHVHVCACAHKCTQPHDHLAKANPTLSNKATASSSRVRGSTLHGKMKEKLIPQTNIDPPHSYTQVSNQTQHGKVMGSYLKGGE